MNVSEIEQQDFPVEDPDEAPVGEDQDQPSRPLPPVVKLLILIAGVAIMAGGAFFLTTKVILPTVTRSAVGDKMTEVKQRLQEPRKKKEKKEKKKKAGPVINYPIAGITANTAGSLGRRFIVVDLMVETTSEKIRDEMIRKDYQVRDALIYYFGGRSVQEISTRGFMISSRDTLRSIINSVLESGSVDTVFFTNFLIQ